MPTKPSYYFDLSHFEHASIFGEGKPVWEVLNEIAHYLKNLKLGTIVPQIPSGAHLINPEQIFIGEGSIVEPGAYIQGPCWIGKNCVVRHGAYIRGNLITGNHCVIGHDTEVKNALFLDHAHAAHFAYVGDSILGNHINLGAGTICANLKLDNQSIAINIEGNLYQTSLRKLGAIVGDGSQIGCNCVLNPGSLIGKRVNAYPCTNFGGFTPSNYLVKSQMSVIKRPQINTELHAK